MRALVLSGGGSKGAFQIGVLKRWMGDEGLDYDIMCGVSVGALNIAGLSHSPYGEPQAAIKWLEDFWMKHVTGTESIYKRWFPFGRLHSLWEKSVYNSRPLMKLVREHLDLSKVKTSGRRLAVGAVCLNTGEHAFGTEEDPNFAEWVLASSSFPVFLTPIEIDGKLWSDGGIVNITPLAKAIEMGATEIDVIICSDPWLDNKWNVAKQSAVPNQIIRTLSLMSDQIAKNDIELTGLKNELADINENYQYVKVRVCVPSVPLNVDSLEFNPSDIVRMIEQGYHDADLAVIWT